MLVVDYADFIQDASNIFTAALTDEVIVKTTDGNRYKILPVEDIPLKAEKPTKEIVELLKEGRVGI
jgi:hypothetical protein